MKSFNCFFHAKRIGALGLWSTYLIKVEANSIEEARLKLYKTYEHIYGFKAEEVNCDTEQQKA